MRKLRQRKGFTLIELLIVIVIIGILAAIAIPKFSKTRERAFYKAMESDLRNLVTQQELFYSLPENLYTYADDVEAEGLDFQSSSGVTVAVTNASATGWAATATHSGLPGENCAVFFEGAEDDFEEAPATRPGVIACTPVPPEPVDP